MAPKLKGYKSGETIAKGYGAKVKKCTHIASGQTVAIKLLSYECAKSNPESLENFKKRGQREMFAVKHLRHSNVMTCYEGKLFKKDAYIVMEWMEGGSLLEYVAERGTLSEGEARRYFRQLIHGINYCHKNLLVHRDVKPSNLLLDETKQYLKIADFGICNYLRDDLTLSTYCGTDFYQAPEIHKDGTSYGGSEVDIYSCGITLYHLIHGCPSSKDFRSDQFCITETDTATSDVDDLISRMTEYEPQHRITIPEIKRHRWFLDGDQAFLDDPHDAAFDEGLDNDVLLETTKKMHCEREDLIQSLLKGKHSEETTTYKLLKKKMRVVEG